MKELKKDLKSVVRGLKSLTREAEKIGKKLDRLEKAQARQRPKAKLRAKARSAKRGAVPQKRSPRKTTRVPASDVVFKVISRCRKGVSMDVLKVQTGFKDKKIRDIVYRLKKLGKIKSLRAGLYVKL